MDNKTEKENIEKIEELNKNTSNNQDKKDKKKKDKKEKKSKDENKKRFSWKNVKHKKTCIAVIIILIFVLFQIFKPKKVVEDPIETQAIEKRTIVTSIAATGTVQTSNSKSIVVPLSGVEVKSVNVKEGQRVSTGDVIAILDTKTLQDSLNTAQASLSLSNAQANLGIESAQRNLNDAINNKNTQASSTQADVDSARKALTDAENALNSSKNVLNNAKNQLSQYKSSAEAQTLNNFSSVETQYNAKLSEKNAADSAYQNQEAVVSTLNVDTEAYNTENKNLADLKANKDKIDSEFVTIKQQYDTMSVMYAPAQAKEQSLTQAVSSAQAQVSSLQANVNQLRQAYDKTVQAHNTTVTAADQSIAGMQDSLTNAKLSQAQSSISQKNQIDQLKEQIADGTVKAPIDGVITSLSVKKGDLYAGSVIATIEGAESFIIESQVDEYDIPDVEVGMEVLIKTDATRDEELNGTITYVAPSATSNQASALTTATASTGSATYKVNIDLNSQNERLRLGMNAKLSIITDKRKDVWTVPYNAIYTRDDGTKYIEILKNEETEEKEELTVTTGLESSYYVEISSDKLKDGMKVVMPKVEATNSMDTLVEMMGADAGI